MATRHSKQGHRLIWCVVCDRYMRIPPTDAEKEFRWQCDRCGSPIKRMRCTRCGYMWTPVGEKLPQSCPKCHSPYWNRERMIS